jgi:hypothetical protein
LAPLSWIIMEFNAGTAQTVEQSINHRRRTAMERSFWISEELGGFSNI